jgi:hypothetical protein
MNPEKVTYFGETDARNKRVPFGIKTKDRTKHVYVIGKTGMGKSTLLENMAIQDIQNGEGIAFIDPHGGTAEKLLEYVPQHRIKDVLYFAPFDLEYPISFNVMEDIGVDKRHLVVNGLMSTFEKIWVDAWSARMAYILNNTLLALLEYPGATLLGVNRMLSDKDYRKKVVDNVTDPSVKSFWIDEFGKYTERFAAEATPAIQNKVGQFTSNPLVRNLIGQPQSTFDIRKIMDEKKILIVNLSKGKVGEGNANLIGSMLITKIYLAAMSRADSSEAGLKNLPNFYLYVDEFQSFANKSFADILSEARKYKLNLTIAHQYIEQMEEEVRDAVFGNVGSMIAFRVGAFDAEVLEKEFAPTFIAEDLVNLGIYQIYLKLMIDGISSAPFSATTMAPIPKPDITYKHDVIESSRATFARPRAVVEEEIKAWHEEGSKREAPKVPKTEIRTEPKTEFKQETKFAPPVVTAQIPPKPVIAEVKKETIVQAEEKSFKPEDKKEKQAIFDSIMQEEKKKELEHQKPRAISLDSLKPEQKKDGKNPTPEHVNQLRQALEALTKNKQSVPESKPQEAHKPHPSHPQHQPQNYQPKQPVHEEKKPNEIPEDELKKLLQVDTD